MSVSSALLTVQDITKRYESPAGATTVLDGVSLSVEPGQTVAVVGPSGSGKSTLLNIIGSLDKPTSGRVCLGAQEVHALEGPALAAFRAGRIGFVFQDHHLLPQLTAEENVLLPALAAGRAAEAKAQARALLEQVGVGQKAEASPARLSGGERQRVAIARALINGAKLLLCDEPTGDLDRDNAAAVVKLFLGLAERDAVTVIMVTHNLELAARFGRCYELKQGRLAPLDLAKAAQG